MENIQYNTYKSTPLNGVATSSAGTQYYTEAGKGADGNMWYSKVDPTGRIATGQYNALPKGGVVITPEIASKNMQDMEFPPINAKLSTGPTPSTTPNDESHGLAAMYNSLKNYIK